MNKAKDKLTELRIETTLKDDYLEQMIKLDDENYSKYDAGVYDLCMSWYNKNPQIYIMALRGTTVVGYINFSPLTDQAYFSYRNGLINDSQLTENDIEKFYPNKKHKCIFISIVVSEKERGGSVTKLLTHYFLDYVKTLKNKSTITSILADCVSEDGEKYIKRLGMTKVLETNRNSVLYEIKNDDGFLL